MAEDNARSLADLFNFLIFFLPVPSATTDLQRRRMAAQGCIPQQGGRINLDNLEIVRNYSERFRAKCSRLISETDEACKYIQKDANKQLDRRLQDVHFLKRELELKLEETTLETDDLIVLQSRVMKSLDACKDPLKATVLCLEERMKRSPSSSDKLYDEVQRELLKENEAIEAAASVLQRVDEQITEQIRLNRSAKYLLEEDLKEKCEAQCIDTSCTLTATHSINNLNTSKNGKTATPSLPVTPKQWENISDMNIGKAEQQKANSMSLRALVESLLEQTAADIHKRNQVTSAALQLNIQRIKSAKSQMEDQLAKFWSELASQHKTREDLVVAVTETEHVLSLAQARLALRQQRPPKEQCHDPAQSRLLAEVQQLTASISKMRKAVAQSDEERRALLRCELALQKSIAIKDDLLYIDEVVCAQHREPIVIRKF
ncbi:tektin-1-like [Brachionichthys hirsutus]|uniref:tektin-1-like n=1 Tax=Brachionichthys hirsutus TaxID=412623 RepID=UPI003604DA79